MLLVVVVGGGGVVVVVVLLLLLLPWKVKSFGSGFYTHTQNSGYSNSKSEFR
jgi:hypothetical protein